MYEDLQPMDPEVQLAALSGKTDVTCKDGGAVLRLRIIAVSSAHQKRRFRFKVCPMDVTLAAERPRLIQLSEAFSVVSHTQTVSKHHPVGPRAAGPANARAANAAGAAPSLAAAAGLSGAVGLNGAPPLTRHRYFSAAELRGATEALQEGDGPPLSRKALGLSDRLAALVAQQVTQRAWQQARKRPLREGEERTLRARDVVSAVRKPGQLDFLFHACALRRWDNPDEAAEAVAGEAEAPLLWGANPDWGALVASQPAEAKLEARPQPVLLQVPQSQQPQPQPQLQQQPLQPQLQQQPLPPQPLPPQAGPPPAEEEEAAASAKRPRTDDADLGPSDAETGGAGGATHQQGHAGTGAASAVVQPGQPSPAPQPDQEMPASVGMP